ncbi:polymerase [Backusella circina FSU 941]|nr:polymerase [Backusella circina FSU 941]
MSYDTSTQQQWGVTPPISMAPPTDYEKKLTEDLVKILHQYDLFESSEEAQRRTVVLDKLDKLVKEFVYRVCIQKGLPESVAREAGGKIFTFGSYRLGVHSAGADIDTLCVFPKYVEREHFFTLMYNMLSERPEVTELTSVVDAYVPVIRLHFSGIPIDFVCAQLSLSSVPDNLDLSDSNLLIGLDERCIRSLNGSRVTDEILRLVPSVPVFRMALRAIKLWAKKRAIYSNIMGFLGGVAWAMLVAKVCQVYPNACAATIVTHFFRIMYQWDWPNPIVLKAMEEGPLQVRQWNPKLYPADKSHRMPIITPAYPSMCATHNVTDSTRSIMLNEFGRTADIANKILIGISKWEDLFTDSDFFLAYNNYLQIVASSFSSETQLKWSGLVESRLRQLVLKLELDELLKLVHPYIKGIDQVHYCQDDDEIWDTAHGNHLKDRTFNVDENDKMTQEEKTLFRPLYTTTFYIGLKIAPISQPQSEPRKLNLIWPTQEFLKSARSWDKYVVNLMSITIKKLKGSMLPVELAGENRRLKKLQLSKPKVPSFNASNII